MESGGGWSDLSDDEGLGDESFGLLLGADVNRDKGHEGTLVTLGFVRLD